MWSVPPFWGGRIGDAMVINRFAGACENSDRPKIKRRCSSGAKSFRCQATLESKSGELYLQGTTSIRSNIPHANEGIVMLGGLNDPAVADDLASGF